MKKNLSLIIALALPILMVIIIAASIYIPRRSVNPQQDFIYMLEDDYGYSYKSFEVTNNKLQRTNREGAKADDLLKATEPKLYIHDVQTNHSREVQYDEVSSLLINGATLSEDGYEVVSGRTGGGFLLFSSGSYGGFFIKNQSGASKKLQLSLSSRDFYRYHFVGWIKK
jgi:hypothetical protein